MNGSKAKLVALAAVVATAVFGNSFVYARTHSPVSSEAAAIVLLPDSIDGAYPVQRWKHPLDGRIVEEGALFVPKEGGASIQLDFYRYSWQAHNGAGCYLTQGERMRSESIRAVRTHDGTALFDIVVTNVDSHLRLTAATECTAAGCSEEALQFGAPWKHWTFTRQAFMRGLQALLVSLEQSPVVPVSIVLQRDMQEDSEEALSRGETQLLQQFEQVAAEFDPAPARRLAEVSQVEQR